MEALPFRLLLLKKETGNPKQVNNRIVERAFVKFSW